MHTNTSATAQSYSLAMRTNCRACKNADTTVTCEKTPPYDALTLDIHIFYRLLRYSSKRVETIRSKDLHPKHSYELSTKNCSRCCASGDCIPLACKQRFRLEWRIQQLFLEHVVHFIQPDNIVVFILPILWWLWLPLRRLQQLRLWFLGNAGERKKNRPHAGGFSFRCFHERSGT